MSTSKIALLALSLTAISSWAQAATTGTNSTTVNPSVGAFTGNIPGAAPGSVANNPALRNNAINPSAGASGNTTINNSTPGTTLNGSANANMQNNSVPGTTASGGVNSSISNNASGSVRAGASASIPPNMNSSQFNTYTSGRWDTNGDGTISATEWGAISPSWFGGKTIPTFNSIDVNNNGALDASEMSSYYSRTNTNLFASYDTNRNGVLDASETARIPAP